MPDPTQVSILKRDGSQVYYSTYTAAKNAASSANRDTIMIWANLKDGTAEQIVLKDKVDIWIAEGVIIDYNPSSSPAPTITDNNVAVECNIYGKGIIKNSYSGSTLYECVKILNASSKISLECDYMEGIGGTNPNTVHGPCVYVTNGTKFHLTCNRIYNHRNCGLFIGSTTNIISDINLDINKIETGIKDGSTYYGSSALITHADGFVKINEIVCSNLGHCFSHRGGTVTARVCKMQTVNNIASLHAATVHVPGPPQGTDAQKLILYFDEIQSLRVLQGSQYLSDDGIQLTGGTGIFIGRRSFSIDGYGIQITRANTMGYVKCTEIISENSVALGLNDFTNQITIDTTFITGNSSGDGGVLFSFDAATFVIKNATLRNKNSSSSSKGIGLFQNGSSGPKPNVTLNNTKIVSNGSVIYQANFTGITIKNYSLFTNKALDSGISLAIGNTGNFLFVNSADLT